MALFNKPEKKTQLFFRDDNCFAFIKRDLKFASLVEMSGDKIIRGWKHFYACQIPFPGYKKNIPADQVTLGFNRDIILDPFNKVPVGTGIMQKPKEGDVDSMKKWVANVAENQRHIYRGKRESTLLTNRIVWAEIAILAVMWIGWLVVFLRRAYGG